jgi:23S rRNA (adenine2030-N6)-methyltransferase
MPRSRYRPGAAPDYTHRLHAGNVGDVWKHVALVEVLRRAAAGGARVAYVDTHAGEGEYELGATGEWTEGIGRLWTSDREPAVAPYADLVHRLTTGAARPATYPGSPAFARAVLGPAATLRLWERDPDAFARLRAHVAGAPGTRIGCGDGLAALAAELRAAEAEADSVVALVDPPWTDKADWSAVPGVVAAALRGTARTSLLLWYPVKSLTRPNAMHARLEASGVAGAIAELVTTPLEHQRRRLNGSGVVIVRPPAGALEALAATAAPLGARCATQDGAWSFRMRALRARAKGGAGAAA